MTETFNVPEVSCGHCKQAIETGVGRQNGVETVNVDLDSKAVTVIYDPTVIDRTGVVRAIESAGYNVAA